MTEATSLGRVLVVDDDASLRETLSDFLQGEGFETAEARNVAEARGRLDQGAFDLILLDISMPGGDGLTLAGELRARISTPIIILSGKGSMIDRVVGLEVGADDYLAKPFELRELLARVRAVLRRTKPAPAARPTAPVQAGERQASVDGLVLVPSRRDLRTSGGIHIDLTGAEYNLFAALVERPHRVLSRDAIADLCRRSDWDAFDRSIDTLVSRLRRKLAPHTDATRLIQTVRGEGYVLAADVKWVE